MKKEIICSIDRAEYLFNLEATCDELLGYIAAKNNDTCMYYNNYGSMLWFINNKKIEIFVKNDLERELNITLNHTDELFNYVYNTVFEKNDKWIKAEPDLFNPVSKRTYEVKTITDNYWYYRTVVQKLLAGEEVQGVNLHGANFAVIFYMNTTGKCEYTLIELEHKEIALHKTNIEYSYKFYNIYKVEKYSKNFDYLSAIKSGKWNTLK